MVNLSSKFTKKMNETAEKAGALDTNFKNPHGLPCNGHYTTARDLSYITCYAMHNTKFEEIKTLTPELEKTTNNQIVEKKNLENVLDDLSQEACLLLEQVYSLKTYPSLGFGVIIPIDSS